MYWLAFITGLFGSLHCLGMCGPIALSLPFAKGSSFAGLIPGRVLYNAGRIISYMILGILFGLAGNLIVLGGFQQYLSLITGGLLILIGVGSLAGWSKPKTFINKLLNKLFASRFGSGSPFSLLLIGVLNGFLPCGLVYIAATMAISGGSPANSAFMMLLFGLGTFPMMLLVSLSPGFLSKGKRWRIKNLSPYLALIMGVLFFVRGLDLGIPYLSPKMNIETEQMECCKPE